MGAEIDKTPMDHAMAIALALALAAQEAHKADFNKEDFLESAATCWDGLFKAACQ